MRSTPALPLFLLSLGIAPLKAVEGWPVSFTKTSKTVPTIELRLNPPEDPYPQVSAALQLLEREDMRTKEAYMLKLQDVFNKMIDESQRLIADAVEKYMKPFEDKKLLDVIVKQLEGRATSTASSKKATTPKTRASRFQQFPHLDSAADGVNTGTVLEVVAKEAMFQDKGADTGEMVNGTDLNDGPLRLATINRHAFDSGEDAASRDPASLISSNKEGFAGGDARSNSVAAEALRSRTEGNERRPSNTERLEQRPLPDGPLSGAASFIQLRSRQAGAGGNVVTNVLKSLQNSAAPMVNVEVVDVFEPPSEIEDKIKQIEQKRNDEEAKMFELAAEELTQLTRITVQELEKNLQIQMNPFLVDTDAVTAAFERRKPAGARGGMAFRQREQATTNVSSVVEDDTSLQRETRDGVAHLGLAGVDVAGAKRDTQEIDVMNAATPQHVPDGPIRDDNPSMAASSGVFHHEWLSFLQLGQGFLNPEQLSVKVGASERPYPTPVDLVSDRQKKRDAIERLERETILKLQQKLMDAQGEMMKDALHEGLAAVLALLGGTSEAVRVRFLAQTAPTE